MQYFMLQCGISEVLGGQSLSPEMSSKGAMADYSGDSVRSPIKRQYTNTSNPDKSTHTLAVDDEDCQSKGSYETARDKRVAELKKMFMPVQQAADTLSVLPLSPFLLVVFFH